jgi:hypothetical protein
MNKKMGLVLALALMGQQLLAIEITRTFTPVELAQSVISEGSLDEAYALLSRCSVEERKEVASVLKQVMHECGERVLYEYQLKGKTATIWLAGALAVSCAVATYIIVNLAVDRFFKAKTQAFEPLVTVEIMPAIYSPVLKNVTGPLSVLEHVDAWQTLYGEPARDVMMKNPYIVSGDHFLSIFHSVKDCHESLKSVENLTQVAAGTAFCAGVFGIAAKAVHDDKVTAQETLDAYDRVQALIAYLEK